MPVFTISTAGGYFTSTATWVGGVVPTSATTSDILGIATSGPLSMGGLGTRTVGSWDLAAYKNTITMTGSSTIMNITGPTFSMNAGITSSIGSNVGNAYRFNIAPTTNIPVCRLKMNGYKFQNSLTFAMAANTQRAEIMDEVIMDENSWLMLGNTTTTQIYSSTASVRGKITFDLINGRQATMQMMAMSTATASYPHFIDLTFKNTSGGTNSIIFNSQTTNPVIGAGLNFIVDGATLYNSTPTKRPLVLGFNCNFQYISGTISPPELNYYIERQTLTIRTHTASVIANGIDWDVFSILGSPNTNQVEFSFFNFNDNFKAKNLIISSQQPAFTNIYFRGTQSSTFQVGNLGFGVLRPIAASTYPFSNYNAANLFLYTGSTYSIDRIISGQIDLSNNMSNNYPILIAGTAGGTAQIQLTNDSVTTATDYQNVDIIGGKKIYALTGTYSGTTGIETNLPTGGAGGGGSFVFAS